MSLERAQARAVELVIERRSLSALHDHDADAIGACNDRNGWNSDGCQHLTRDRLGRKLPARIGAADSFDDYGSELDDGIAAFEHTGQQVCSAQSHCETFPCAANENEGSRSGLS
ncbi:MAG TPA: hypothetical protein VF021_00445 [Longimicrobiales bacterium]